MRRNYLSGLHKIFCVALILEIGYCKADEIKENAQKISIEGYIEMVKTKSLPAVTAGSNFSSAKNSYYQSRLQMTAPNLSFNSAVTQSNSFERTSEGISKSLTSAVSMSQPFLWGGNLSLSGSRDVSDSVTDSYTGTSSGERVVSTSRSYSRTFPTLTASYQQPLYIFIRNEKLRNWRVNRLNFQNSKNDYDRQIQELEFKAKTQYIQTMVAQKRLEVEMQKVKSAETLYTITETMVEAGQSAPVELLRAKISRKLDERRVRNAQVEVQQVINSFKQLGFIEVDKKVELVSQLKYMPIGISLDKLVMTALNFNPQLQRAKQSVQLSEFQIQSTKEGILPKFNFSAQYSYRDPESSSLSRSWSMGTNMEWSFFDSWVTVLSIKNQRLAYENANRDLGQLIRQTKLDVENAYLELLRAQEQIEDFAQTRKDAEENVSIVRFRFEKGLDRLLDVFDAENKMRELELEYLTLLNSYIQSVDRLTLLVGKDVYVLAANLEENAR